MNRTPLKASLLATAIAFASATPLALAHDHEGTPDRTLGQTVEDATITAAVKTALLADTRTEGFDINVDTHAGKVTLSGGADTAADKLAATELATAVDGVVSVDNQLIVAAEGTQLRIDANTATASGEVRAATEDAADGIDEEGNNPSLTDMDGDGVDEVGPGPDAEVNDRVGTGTGVALDADDVDTDGQAVVDNDADLETDVDADAAADGSADIDGDVVDGTPRTLADTDGDGVDEVDDANDLLGDTVDDDRLGDGTGGPSDVVDDAWITSKVKTQLLADAAVAGMAIDVDTKANVVTLHGTVESVAAHEAALRIAKGTDGVKQVVDNLTVR